jgi:hypothetical protein
MHNLYSEIKRLPAFKNVNTILVRTQKLRVYKYTSGNVCLQTNLTLDVDKRSN